MSSTTRRDGAVLLSALMGITVATLIAGGFFLIARNAMTSARRWQQSDQLLLVAQGALEQAKTDLDVKFRAYADTLLQSWQAMSWYNTYSSTQIGLSPPYLCPQGTLFRDSGAQVWINVIAVTNSGPRARDVVLRCRAQYQNRTDLKRTVEETVRFRVGPSRVFDYIYFINNYGWFWGSGIRANGDARANGNFDLQSSPLVNGDLYAAAGGELGSAGTVSGNWNNWSLSSYYSGAPTAARPGSPPAVAGPTWAMGYDGSPEKFQYLQPLEMPYLGTLANYEALATEFNGKIRQRGATVVTNTYAGYGPDNKSNTPDDGTVILDGRTNAIEITGPVVVRGDVIIRGKITGQGVIYAGRNIHIAGDLIYQNPAVWPHPDPNPMVTVSNNGTKDLIGLAAKGNIVIGDYTASAWQSATAQYMKPNFTKPYNTDASDAANGYDSDKNAGNGYRFAGDYTAADGGKRMDSTTRKYYESSLSNKTFASISRSNTVSRLDAILYSNHLVSGKVGADLLINGGIVSRDEALIFNNTITMNWDIRVGSESEDSTPMSFFLPHEFSRPWTMVWTEGP